MWILVSIGIILKGFKKLALQKTTGKSWRDASHLGQIVPIDVLLEVFSGQEEVNTDYDRFKRYLHPKADKPVDLDVTLSRSEELGSLAQFGKGLTKPNLDHGIFIVTYSAIWRGIYKKLIFNLTKQLSDTRNEYSVFELSLMTFVDESIYRHCKYVINSPLGGHSIGHSSIAHRSILEHLQDLGLIDEHCMITSTGIKYGSYLDYIVYIDSSIKCPFDKFG